MTEQKHEYLTTAEAAKLSRRDPKTLRNRVYAGLPPRAVRVGGRLLFPRKDLEAWMCGDLEDDTSPRAQALRDKAKERARQHRKQGAAVEHEDTTEGVITLTRRTYDEAMTHMASMLGATQTKLIDAQRDLLAAERKLMGVRMALDEMGEDAPKSCVQAVRESVE